jgi:hypothetical protein
MMDDWLYRCIARAVDYSYPVIEFTDMRGAGEVILAQGRVGSNPPDYRVGDVVDVLYDP